MKFSEQETTVTTTRTDDVVYIWTSHPVHLRKLRKDPRATERRGDVEWAEFTVPKENYDPVRGLKTKRVMSDEQRRLAGERLRKAREQ